MSPHTLALEMASKRHAFPGVSSGQPVFKLLSALYAEITACRRSIRDETDFTSSEGFVCYAQQNSAVAGTETGATVIAIHKDTGAFVQLDGTRLSAGQLFLYAPPVSSITPETTTVQMY